jgi:hypothetical protein
LNAGLWFRRGRLAMVFSSLAASCRCCAENPLIPAVQISGTTSDLAPKLENDLGRNLLIRNENCFGVSMITARNFDA